MADTVMRSSGQHRRVHSETRSSMETVVTRVVYYVAAVIETFLAFRFLLRLFGANAEAAFVQFVYNVSDVFVAPFNAIFSTQEVEGAVFEWSVLVAMAVYALLAWGIAALIMAVSPREHASTVEQVEQVNEEQDSAHT